MFSRLLLAIAVAATLSACTTTSGPRIAPERSISIDVNQKAAKDAFAQHMVGEGFLLSKDTEYSMEFWRKTKDAAAAFWLSSNYNYTVHTRIIITFIGSDPTTVSMRAFYVTNPLSAHERLTDITDSPKSDELGLLLKKIKVQIEGG